ncbi:hypothetical protein CO695_13140 [Providencia alcalifaciens]|uniref:Uncharacterized protein n=1 Tax=Providencia alcalifaciens DSM 30120 TaxID=520999 RepID=B6XF85_9GAMM|nr:hypothetical protein [Providencia alcalifaciens]ATG17194.1 hypothetical protein CO695_13140 [Providencia alcalifaciens]EEB46173.1 hypothetical protein PROVALCAL_02017 [Providencia alcalifaciens DSM 30120]SQI37954.1 Uncharacterised protein [Providencia alcalifaciens]
MENFNKNAFPFALFVTIIILIVNVTNVLKDKISLNSIIFFMFALIVFLIVTLAQKNKKYYVYIVTYNKLVPFSGAIISLLWTCAEITNESKDVSLSLIINTFKDSPILLTLLIVLTIIYSAISLCDKLKELSNEVKKRTSDI